MKAAVLYGPYDLRVEEVKTPRSSENDVLVKVIRAGICMADLEIYRFWKEMSFWEGNTRPVESGGRMIGHEFLGEVVEMGHKAKSYPRLSMFNVGDRIAGAGSFNCVAEYVLLKPDSQVSLHKIPPEVSEEEASLVERLTTAWGAFEGGGRRQNELAVVIGTGGIGLCLVQMLKSLSNNRVIAVDVSDKRLALAKRFGADEVVNPGTEDTREKIIQITGALPAVAHMKPSPPVDAVYDCIGYVASVPGVKPALVQALEIIRPTPREVPAGEGSRIVMVGSFEKPVPLDLLALLVKRTKIVGTFGGSHQGMDECFELIRTKKLSFKGLVSHVFPLAQSKEAFETAMKPKEALQVQIKP